MGRRYGRISLTAGVLAVAATLALAPTAAAQNDPSGADPPVVDPPAPAVHTQGIPTNASPAHGVVDPIDPIAAVDDADADVSGAVLSRAPSGGAEVSGLAFSGIELALLVTIGLLLLAAGVAARRGRATGADPG